MDSRLNVRTLVLALAAVALSGTALYLSQGLYPRWWASWLAALPVLLVAPRLSWPIASSAAFAAALIGGLSMWDYHQRLQFPLWLQLASVVTPAVAFCVSVILFRSFFQRGRTWLAVLAFPAVMVAYEYLISLGFGTFGTTAYTQLSNLPVLQLGPLTGLWGISFLVMLFPSMIAAIALSPPVARRRMIGAFVVIFGCPLTYGLLRLSTTPQAPQAINVGLAVSDLPKNTLPEDDRDAMRLLREYAEQVKLLSQRGAKIVVLPEMTALVRDSISRDVDELFGQAARDTKTQILLGVLHATSKATYNEARLYSGAGAADVVYRKHHLVPVVEGRTTPGNDISVIRESFGSIGLTICRDMDYPNPSRQYGKAQVGLVLAPAWDFDIDRAWHGHMAIMRGVENGFAVVRAAKRGLLTVSDSRGRILSEVPTTPIEPFTTMIATVPVHHETTLYQSWGDWFAWVDLAFVTGLMIIGVMQRPRQRNTSRTLPRSAAMPVA